MQVYYVLCAPWTESFYVAYVSLRIQQVKRNTNLIWLIHSKTMQHSTAQATWYISSAHSPTVQMKAGGCLSDRKLNIYCCRCVCRGEKLYVTKDKRQSQSWRRCICWGCGFVLLSVAILIAVLAGSEYTAVIYSAMWLNCWSGDWRMSMEHRLNDTDTGTHKSSKKSLAIATISTTICTWTVLG